MKLDFNTQPEILTRYLQSAGWITTSDAVKRLEKPGEGNMNMVIRVVTEQKTLILKQSSPYVQKYPQIAAPQERCLVEAEFYQLVQSTWVKQTMPAFLGVDKTNFILALEDLGVSADYTFLYKKGQVLEMKELENIVSFLNELHDTSFDEKIVHSFPDNLPLRRLNHEHLFHYPYLLENGFNLDSIQPGLQELSLIYKRDDNLKKILVGLGQIYLGSGSVLLHGDYYPGSWLKAGGSLKVIDPEFCYFGKPEYDLGICMAHMKMAQQPGEYIGFIETNYQAPGNFNYPLMRQFTGMEILRRIIGLAQLPLDLTLAEREALLKEAANAIKKNYE